MKKLVLFVAIVCCFSISFSLTKAWHTNNYFLKNSTSLTSGITALTIKSVKAIDHSLKSKTVKQKNTATIARNVSANQSNSSTNLSNNAALNATMFFADVSGDYRSSGSGNWKSLASWQYYNGSSWATPTVVQGYPGQFTGTNKVTIQATHIITLSTGTAPPDYLPGSFSTTIQTMGELTINGKLILGDGQSSGNGNGTRRDINMGTDKITIGSSGELNFNNKSLRLRLPNPNAIIIVNGTPSPGGKITSSLDCDINIELYIGDRLYAVCADRGNGTTITFGNIVTSGGTINAEITNPTSNPINQCGIAPINLSGKYIGTETNVDYIWIVRNPNNVTSTIATGTLISSSAISSISFTPTIAGQYLISFEVTKNGFTNIETRTFNINLAPAISTSYANIPANNTPGQCGANVSYATAVATGLPAPTITYSQASGTFFPIGTTTVTVTATNTCGTDTKTFNIIVSDNEAPIITCPSNQTVVLDTSCGGLMPDYTSGVASDNCSVTVTQSPAPGTSYNGDHTVSVILTANDGNNSVNCSFDVLFDDQTSPQALCKPATVILDANGNASITAADINNGSNDACGIASLSVSPNSFTCANIGANTVTLSVTDNNGNVSTCTATVTVEDNSVDYANLQFPGSETICEGNTMTAYGQVYEGGLTNSSNAPVSAIDVQFAYHTTNTDPSTWPEANWTNASPNPNYNFNQNNDEYFATFGSALSPGTYYYTFRYSLTGCNWQYGGFPNGFWNGSNQNNGVLTILENHILNLSSANNNQTVCPNSGIVLIVYTVGGGANSATITPALPVGLSFNPATATISGTPTQSGVYNYTVTTVGNNCAPQQLSGSITVKELLDYANLQFPGSATICTGGSIDAYGRIYEPGLTPNPGNPGSIVDAEFGYGANSDPLTWTNWADAAYNVQVGNDDEYKSTFGSNLTAGTYYYTFRYALDGCQWQYGGFTSTGGGFLGGSNVVGVLTVNKAPVITNTYSTISANTNTGVCGATVTYPAAVTTGTPAPTITYSTPSGSLFPVGTTTVTVTATNSCGTDVKTFNVTVTDNQAPNAICQNITVDLDANGAASITPQQVNNGSSDACGIASLSLDKLTFNCSDVTFATAPSSKVVISQVYGGGGNTGAPFNRDFIELFNSGTTTVNLNGWSVQYASAGGNSWGITALTGSIQPGQYYLVGGASGSNGSNLPNVNVDGSLNLSGTAGKVLLSNNTATQSVTCPTGSQIMDFVRFGTGTSSCSGTTATAAPSNTTSVVRKTNGCQDTDDNAADFIISAPTPRNSSTALAPCSSGASGTPVTLTVTDNHNNTSTCTAYVTVRDLIPPVLTPAPNQDVNLSSSTNTCRITIPDVRGSATDNCTGTIITQVPAVGAVIGTSHNTPTNVIVTATDASGNTHVKTVVLTAKDITPPTLTPATNQNVNLNGSCKITIPNVKGTATDNCSGTTITQNPSAGTVLSAIHNQVINVTVTATDGANLTDVKTVVLTAKDVTPPTVITQNITIPLNANGVASINPSQVNDGSTDNCGTVNLVSVIPNTFDCSNIVKGYPTDLIISEYVEGSSNNKYIEIYNGTANPINLSGYQLSLYVNGSGSPTSAGTLTGTINAGGTAVFRNSSASPEIGVSLTNLTYNGDDAVALRKSNGAFVDIIGRVGNDPGTAWTLGGNTTENKTLRRKPTVVNGITVSPTGTGPTAFTTLASEWDQYDEDDISGLGSHGIGNVVTLTINDGNGNTSTGTAYVTVEDNIAPIITCVASASRNTDAGVCTYTIQGTEFDATFTDNCADGSITNSLNGTASIAGVVFQKGETTVTWTVNDGNGQSATCSTTITVDDNEAPMIACPANGTRDTDAGVCNYTIQGTEFDATFTDNCADGNITNNLNGTASIVGEVFQKGATTVVWTVNDGNGQSATCSTTITIEDNESPVIACVTNGTRDTDAGVCTYTIQGTEFDATFTDNCADGSITNSLNGTASIAGEVFQKGATTITWTVHDGNGQSASCSTTITVEDNEAPVITCAASANRDTDPGQCTYTILGTEFDATFTDNCSDGNITNDFNGTATIAGEVFQKGVTTVIWTVDDGNGQIETCSTVITIIDNEAPVIACQDLQVFLNENGTGSITAAQITQFATDNCEIASISISQTNFDCSDIGGDLDDLIISEYIDGSGFENYIELYNGTGVTVNLSEYSLLVYYDGSSTPTVYPLGGTIDDRMVSIISHPSALYSGDLANNTVLLNFDGNDAVALSHNGTIVDLLPVYTSGVSLSGTTLRRNQDVNNGNVSSGSGSDGWSQYSNTVIGNLGSHTIIFSDNENNVELTVTDTSGNTSTCIASVTVIDNTPPVVVCQNITVQLNASGNVSITADDVELSSSDACGIASLSLDIYDFTCANVGTNTVTLTATDRNGNSNTCTATVTVEDNVPPVAAAQDFTVELDANGNANITPQQIDNGSSDACGILSITVSPDTFDCSNVGNNNTVTLTVTDNNNNVSTATATVTVRDNIAPVAVCQNITVALDSNGYASIIGSDVDGGSTDACGIASYSVSVTEFNCSNIGANNVVLTVKDVNGNMSTCDAVVTVTGIVPTVTISQSALPEFCQGAVVVLTASTTQPQSDIRSYAWSGAGVTLPTDGQSVSVSDNGIYTVEVTSETNCTTTATFEVTGFDAGALISSYTILAIDEVFLHGSNLVQTGAVGAKTPGTGTIKLHQATTVVGFAQAANIVLNQGSTVGSAIYQPATPTIPTFLFNTQSTTSSPNETVNNNQTQSLTGSVYNVITIKQGASVTFTQPNVYINEIRTFENATINFAGCTNVYLNEKLMLARGGKINTTGKNVVFYVNNDVQIEQGSNVRARIHLNGNEILAKGANANGNTAAEPTYMTGLFIANKVHGNKNVIWNADPVCEPCSTSSAGAQPPVANNGFKLNTFTISAWPNPSEIEFNIKLNTENLTDKAVIKVFDMNNKLVFTSQFGPQETYRFGKELPGGVYVIKVMQGKDSATERLIKY